MHITIKVLSKSDDYDLDYFISVRAIRKINEGKYSSVYLTNYKNYVVKILKKKQSKYFIKESEIFNKLKDKKNYPKHLIKYILHGIIYECDKIKYKNKDLLVMNRYNEFNYLYPELKSIPLIFYKDYKYFILEFIYKLLLVNKFIEDELNAVNIDINIQNIMINNNDIIMIDLGMLIENKNDDMYIDNLSNYITWPYGKTKLKYIANYSIAITAIHLLYKNKNFNIDLDNNIKIVLKILLAKKYNTSYVIDFIKEHYGNFI